MNWLLDYPVILCQSLLFSIVLVGTLSEQRNFWQKIRNIWIHKTCRFQLMWIDFPFWLTYLLTCHYLWPWTTCYLSDLLHFDIALFRYFTFGTFCPKSFFCPWVICAFVSVMFLGNQGLLPDLGSVVQRADNAIQWISVNKTYGATHWIVIYPVGIVIHCSNHQSLMSKLMCILPLQSFQTQHICHWWFRWFRKYLGWLQ